MSFPSSSASKIPSGTSNSQIQEKLIVYLQDPDAHNVIVRMLYPRLVQRSYGREKRWDFNNQINDFNYTFRFFCPPPVVFIGGPGWRKCSDDIAAVLETDIDNSPLNHHESILNENLRWYCELGLNDDQCHLTSNIEFALVTSSYFVRIILIWFLIFDFRMSS